MFETEVAEKIKTQILCSIRFRPKNRTVRETMWKNKIEPDTKMHALCILHN